MTIGVKDAIVSDLKMRGRCRIDTAVKHKSLYRRIVENQVTFINAQQFGAGFSQAIKFGICEYVTEDNVEYLYLTEKGEQYEADNPFLQPLPYCVGLKSIPAEKSSIGKGKKDPQIQNDFSFLDDWSVTKILSLIAHASTMVKGDIDKFKQGIVEGL